MGTTIFFTVRIERLMRIATILCVAATCCLTVGCGNNNHSPADLNFDRRAMLEYCADSIIIPRLEKLSNDSKILSKQTEEFVQNPNIQTLIQLQEKWKTTFLQWQLCTFLNFGPGESQFGTLAEDIGTFPARINGSTDGSGIYRDGIEDYIARGDYLFKNFSRDTRGFLGMEYLLFSKNNDSILSLYSPQQINENRRQYLRAIAVDIEAKATAASAEWKHYKNDFIANNGSSAGSSIAILYNSCVKSFEDMKNYKLLLPAGKRAGQIDIAPNAAEAYYSGLSLESIKKHWEGIMELWQGISESGQNDGLGFDDYLRSTTTGTRIVDETKHQQMAIDNILQKNIEKQIPLSILIERRDSDIELLIAEFQKITRFLKSETSSALGISITYSSGDGD